LINLALLRHGNEGKKPDNAKRKKLKRRNG